MVEVPEGGQVENTMGREAMTEVSGVAQGEERNTDRKEGSGQRKMMRVWYKAENPDTVPDRVKMRNMKMAEERATRRGKERTLKAVKRFKEGVKENGTLALGLRTQICQNTVREEVQNRLHVMENVLL